MSKPIVAVVGRPNVGKSTFFNKIVGKRISIVKDTPGVTRDRIFADAEWCGYNFTLVDTGGIELKSTDDMYAHIIVQSKLAIEAADVILFFTDGREGVTASDYDVAEILRQSGKPVILAVNKLDNFDIEKTYDFYSLGLGDPVPVSCEQGKGLGDLLDEIVNKFPDKAENAETEALKIALVGKPNVGKSSLVNKLIGSDRVIVSDVAGTTRDAIDIPFESDGKKYVLIDTAGMRRKRGIEEDSVEYYGVVRSLAAVRRADVVLILMSAEEEMSEQDVKIAGFVHDEGKPSVIVMNKWDLVEKDTFTIESYMKNIKEQLKFMDYLKAVFVSAKTGQRLNKILEVAEESFQNASRRIQTGVLNDVIADAVAMNEPPVQSGNRRLKLYYSTQASTNPPKIMIFVNEVSFVHFSYKRYLENVLRKTFDFSGTPIEIIFNKNKGD